MSRTSDALEQIVFARNYTIGLIDTIPAADWFRMPPAGVTHVAWQVGHLAMAEYRLCLERIRGPRPEDANLLPPIFHQCFGRGSMPPDPDPAKYPPAAEIRAVFDRVHERALAELPGIPDADLDAPITVSHRFCKTKIQCVRWCPMHEMSHAGQIGLLRRLFGADPIW